MGDIAKDNGLKYNLKLKIKLNIKRLKSQIIKSQNVLFHKYPFMIYTDLVHYGRNDQYSNVLSLIQQTNIWVKLYETLFCYYCFKWFKTYFSE